MPIDCHGENKTIIVVGMLPNQIDPARGPGEMGRPALKHPGEVFKEAAILIVWLRFAGWHGEELKRNARQ